MVYLCVTKPKNMKLTLTIPKSETFAVFIANNYVNNFGFIMTEEKKAYILQGEIEINELSPKLKPFLGNSPAPAASSNIGFYAKDTYANNTLASKYGYDAIEM